MFDGCPFCGRISELSLLLNRNSNGDSTESPGLYHHPYCPEAESVKVFTYAPTLPIVRRKGGTIEHWRVCGDEAPSKVTGLIFGDERFRDGMLLTTTQICTIDLESMRLITKNTEYKLGQP